MNIVEVFRAHLLTSLQRIGTGLFSFCARSKSTNHFLALQKRFKVLENSPVCVASSEENNRQLRALSRIAKYLKQFESADKKQYETLLRYYIGAMYRLGEKQPSFSLFHFNWLKMQAEKWSRDHELLRYERLSRHILLLLHETARYPELVELFKTSQTVFEMFLKWCVRDRCNAKVFILFPCLQERLVEVDLQGRLGFFPDVLQIQPLTNPKTKEKQWHVTLRFDGVDHSILNEKAQITFRGNWTLSIKEIFAVFKNKEVKEGDLEIFQRGVTNWNVHKWAYWDAEKQAYQTINFSHHRWWLQLPVFEVLTTSQASQRYGLALDGKKWVAAATANRGARTLDYQNTHAFLEYAIPLGDGRYQIFDFGKYATQYPSSFFESVSMLCKNQYATISYPDVNMFYSHRELAYYPFLISEEEGIKMLAKVQRDMISGVQKNFVYQIESENCAKWARETLEYALGEKRVPHLFYMNLLQTEPEGPVAYIFAALRNLPNSWQVPALALSHYFLGSYREIQVVEEGRIVVKSLAMHEFSSTGHVFLPSLLVKKIEFRELPLLGGVIETLADAVHQVSCFVKRLYSRLRLMRNKRIEGDLLSYFSTSAKRANYEDSGGGTVRKQETYEYFQNVFRPFCARNQRKIALTKALNC